MTVNSLTPLAASMPVMRVVVSATDRGLSLVTTPGSSAALSSAMAYSFGNAQTPVR